MSYNTLLYGDSLVNININNLKDFDFEIASYPGHTTEDLINLDKKGIGLSYLLEINKYKAVIICAGINDSTVVHSDIIDNLHYLYKICQDYGIKVIGVFLPNNDEFNLELETNTGEDIDFNEFFLTAKPEHFGEDKLHLNNFGKQEFLKSIKRTLFQNFA